VKLACSKCNQIYDEETESMVCSHAPFPKRCDKHDTFFCGMGCDIDKPTTIVDAVFPYDDDDTQWLVL
jgi:hypothetical protein